MLASEGSSGGPSSSGPPLSASTATEDSRRGLNPDITMEDWSQDGEVPLGLCGTASGSDGMEEMVAVTTAVEAGWAGGDGLEDSSRVVAMEVSGAAGELGRSDDALQGVEESFSRRREPASSDSASSDTASSAPASRDTASSAPASRDTASSAPASRDTASSAPASRDTASSAPASRDTASSAPASRDTASSAPASRISASSNSASSDSASSNSVSSMPASPDSASTPPPSPPPSSALHSNPAARGSSQLAPVLLRPPPGSPSSPSTSSKSSLLSACSSLLSVRESTPDSPGVLEVTCVRDSALDETSTRPAVCEDAIDLTEDAGESGGLPDLSSEAIAQVAAHLMRRPPPSPPVSQVSGFFPSPAAHAFGGFAHPQLPPGLVPRPSPSAPDWVVRGDEERAPTGSLAATNAQVARLMPKFEVKYHPPPPRHAPASAPSPWRTPSQGDRARSVLDALECSALQGVDPPPGSMAVPLLEHQRMALAWMLEQERPTRAKGRPRGGILADEQGLGKTVCAAALIATDVGAGDEVEEEEEEKEKKREPSANEDDEAGSTPSGQPSRRTWLTERLESMPELSPQAPRVSAQAPPAQVNVRFALGGDESPDEHLPGSPHAESGLELSLLGEPLVLGQTLVVCPASVLHQWRSELCSKVPALRAPGQVVLFHGPSRTRCVRALARARVVLTTYHTMVSRAPITKRGREEGGPGGDDYRRLGGGGRGGSRENGANSAPLPAPSFTCAWGLGSAIVSSGVVQSLAQGIVQGAAEALSWRKRGRAEAARPGPGPGTSKANATYVEVASREDMERLWREQWERGEQRKRDRILSQAQAWSWSSDRLAKALANLSAASPPAAPELGLLYRLKWRRLVLDEAQFIKNYRSASAVAAYALHAGCRWCLTGTPVQNALMDIYSYFRLLRFAPYDRLRAFKRDVEKPVVANADATGTAYRALRALLARCVLRRTKKSLLPDGRPILELPAKVVRLQADEFSEEERRFYDMISEEAYKNIAHILDAGKLGTSMVDVLVQLLRLRQACDHPWLLLKASMSASLWSARLDAPHAKQGDGRLAPRLVLATHPTASARSAAPGGGSRAALLAALRGAPTCERCQDLCEEPVISSCQHVCCAQCLALWAEDEGHAEREEMRRLEEGAESRREEEAGRRRVAHGAAGSSRAVVAFHHAVFCPACRKRLRPADFYDEAALLAGGKTADGSAGEKDPVSERKADEEEEEDNAEARRILAAFHPRAPAGLSTKIKGLLDYLEGVLRPGGEAGQTLSSKRGSKEPVLKREGGLPSTNGDAAPEPAPPPAVKEERGAANSEGRAAPTPAAPPDQDPPTREKRDADSKPSKVLVFSQWTSMLDLVAIRLKERRWEFERVDGTMTVMARAQAIEAFTAEEDVRILLVSLKAASVGLNLTAANHVVLLDPWWNPMVEEQAVDRAHRIGQWRDVTVTRLVVKDTVEDKILMLQEKKRKMINATFGEFEEGGGAYSINGNLTLQDVRFLFGQ